MTINIWQKKWVASIMCLAFISFFIIYHFFFILKVNQYPWWYQFGNDTDGGYCGQTVSLLNNSRLRHTHHPGATIYASFGIVYRFLAIFNKSHKDLLHLSSVKNIEEAVKILDTSVRTGRIIALFISLLFIVIFFGLLYVLTNQIIITAVLTFFLATSKAFFLYTYMVRPEVLNLLFFLLALLIMVIDWKEKSFSKTRFFLAGFCLGLSIFSKIQIMPAVLMFLIGSMLYLFQKKGIEKKSINSKKILSHLFLPLINLIVMPWWVLRRPAFLTPQYISSLYIGDDFRKVYGLLPESFLFLVAGALAGMFVLSFILRILRRKQNNQEILQRVVGSVEFINFIILGIIISIYVILLPVSGSFSSYIENTRHLVYATLTNVIYGGFLVNRILDITSFQKIVEMHSIHSSLLGINVLIIISIIIFFCAIRLFDNVKKEKGVYGFILSFFLLAFIMDIFATMRWYKLYGHYAFYSLTFFIIGMAQWLTLYSKDLSSLDTLNRIAFVSSRVVVIGLILQVFYIGFNFKDLSKDRPFVEQTPVSEFRNTKYFALPFWEIVEESIRKNNLY